jgi:APA family basic amino acid/polyamine antiporter
MKNPKRNLPRAILLALGLSTAFYILVAISAVSVVGWSSLSQTNAPLALVAEQAMGRNAGFILSLISLAATGNTVLILLLAASRITHAMSCAGVFPVSLCRVLKKRRSPWLAIVATGIVSILFISFRSVQQVAEYTNFVTLMAFIGVNASAAILLSRGNSGIYRYVILNKIVPVLGILISLWLAINLGWRAAVLGAILLVIGLLVYWAIKFVAGKKGVDSF